MARQIALTLNAALQTDPASLGASLGRVSAALSQLAASLQSPGAQAALSQGASPLQVFLEVDLRAGGQIQDVINQLRAMGAKVEVLPSESRPGFSQVLISLGQAGAETARMHMLAKAQKL